jgi:hypothetical protein
MLVSLNFSYQIHLKWVNIQYIVLIEMLCVYMCMYISVVFPSGIRSLYIANVTKLLVNRLSFTLCLMNFRGGESVVVVFNFR